MRANQLNHRKLRRLGLVRVRPLLVALLLLALLAVMLPLPASTHAEPPSFGVRREFGAGLNNVEALAIGDIDGDGDLDVVAGNDYQQSLVYLNDGLGNFHSGPFTCGLTAAVRCFGSPQGYSVRSVRLGDVDTYHSRICRAKFPGGWPRRAYRSAGRPNREIICTWV